MSTKSDMQIEQEEDNIDVKKFSILVQTLRDFLRITQTDLGKHSTLSRSCICRTEGGHRRLLAFNQRRIIKGLGLSCEEFYNILENEAVMDELIARKELSTTTDKTKIKRFVNQLIQESENDLTSMKLLLINKQYPHALIFLYKNIENLLFGLFVKTHQVNSPLVHNNMYLLKTIDSEELQYQETFLSNLKQSLTCKTITKDDFNSLLIQAFEFRKWIKTRLE